MSNDYTKIAKQLETYNHVQGLMKYINYESLLEQHKKQIKGKATGIDGVDKEEYEKELNVFNEWKMDHIIIKIFE